MRRERELEVGENDKKPLTVELLNLLRNLVEGGLLAFVGELTTMASSNLIPDLVEMASTLTRAGIERVLLLLVFPKYFSH